MLKLIVACLILYGLAWLAFTMFAINPVVGGFFAVLLLAAVCK